MIQDDSQCAAHVGFRWEGGQRYQERFYHNPTRCSRAAVTDWQSPLGGRIYRVCLQHHKLAEEKGILP